MAFGFEKFNNPLEDQKIEKRKRKKSKKESRETNQGMQEEKITRRQALKKIAKGTAMAAGIVSFTPDRSGKTSTAEGRLEDKERKSKEGHQENAREKENNLADFYLKAYYEIAKTEAWQKEVLTETLFMAQQMQESGYDAGAESEKEAVGVMQVRGISIKDITKYLNKLKDRGIIEFEGPKELSEEDIGEIKSLIKKSADYGRAFGKIYMAQLCDYRYGYGVGERAIKRKDFKEAQKEILAVYNGGISRITYKKEGESLRRTKKESSWPKESRNYYKKIFNYEKRINNIKNSFQKKGLEIPDNNIIKNIALEMDKYNSKDRYTMLDRLINKRKEV